MPLIWDRSDPKYKNWAREKYQAHLKEYTRIRDQYRLDIEDWVLDNQALKYAIAEADSHFQVFSDAFKGGNLLAFIGALLQAIGGVVMGAIVSVFSLGLASPAGVALMTTSIIGAIATIAGTITSSIISDYASSAQGFNVQLEGALKESTSLSQHSQSTLEHSIAHDLIFNAYAIFPEGVIYKDENPGGLGYRAGLEAPNCMKGINGTKGPNFFAEQINNTQHRFKAGNTHYDPLHLPFPLAKAQQDYKMHKEIAQQAIKQRMLSIQQGFSELIKEGFGAFDTHSPKAF
ncbi:hypothetical protein [Helicobacter vulpis]|uniref:hypothetical protein n=1 Tax=Helicobacter vulpis TaxID=2316076 RepID=UPI001969A2F1|nr:hypothetical protein [Helicobacter vulpis]